MRSREAINRAKNKYDKNALKRVTIKFNKAAEADVIAYLYGKGNITAYIKALIAADMEKGAD